MNKIYQPFSEYGLNLKNKIIMAPMTRGFANNLTGEVNQLIADYYARRARYDVGLIISEGIAINNTGKGTFGIPGIYTERQVESWKKVTEKVHKENGKIFAQLWHVGRLSHSFLTNGQKPVAPSAVQADGLVHKLRKPYEKPVELTESQINILIEDYKKAAINAMEAGFDGVEIHAAHGYLIDQFINEKTNLREDSFGGSEEARLIFLEKVVESVSKVIPTGKLSVRISEKKDDDPSYYWKKPELTLSKIVNILNRNEVKILHISVDEFNKPLKKDNRTLHELARSLWDYTLIGVGNIFPKQAIQTIENDEIDLVALGRPFIANPDLVLKMQSHQCIKLYEYDINELY